MVTLSNNPKNILWKVTLERCYESEQTALYVCAFSRQTVFERSGVALFHNNACFLKEIKSSLNWEIIEALTVLLPPGPTLPSYLSNVSRNMPHNAAFFSHVERIRN